MIIYRNNLQTYSEGQKLNILDFNCIHHVLQKCYKYSKSCHNCLGRLSSLKDSKELSIRGRYSKQGCVLFLLLLTRYEVKVPFVN